MKNVFKNKKLLITAIIGAIALVVIALLITFGVQKIINHLNPEEEISAIDKDLLKMGVPQKDIDKMTDKEKDEIIQNHYYERTVSKDYIYNSKNKEYSSTKEMRTLLYTYLGSYSFSSIVNRVEPLIDKFNFTTTENRELIRIYEDATMLTQIYGFTNEVYENVLSNMISPVVYTAVYLGAPTKVVKEITELDEARFPIFKDIIRIEDYTKLEGNDLTNDKNYIFIDGHYTDQIDSIYKVKISGMATFGQTSTECYIKKSNSNKLSMLGCFDVNQFSLHVTELE